MLGVAAVFGFTFVVMWLWNWLVPELFNGPVLEYWQTLGLLILSKILFSGIGGGHGDKSHYRHESKYCGPEFLKSRWRQKFEAKMNGKVDEKDVEGEEIVTE